MKITVLKILGRLKELAAAGRHGGLRNQKAGAAFSFDQYEYDRETQKPILKCSICNGEQVAGFKDIRTGKFEEIALIRNPGELDAFMKACKIDEISREY